MVFHFATFLSATILTHPHPTNVEGIVVFMLAEDPNSLERVLRLFPVRTGVPVPAWLVLTKESDQLAAAGIVGAGLWGKDWGWNESSSWIESTHSSMDCDDK